MILRKEELKEYKNNPIALFCELETAKNKGDSERYYLLTQVLRKMKATQLLNQQALTTS